MNAINLTSPLNESSPTFERAQKKQRPLLLIQRQREDLNFEADRSEGRYRSETQRATWNKPKKAKGSMLCSELWSPRQRKQAGLRVNSQFDITRVKKITRDSIEGSTDYVGELMSQLSAQFEQNQSSRVFNFELFSSSQTARSYKPSLDGYFFPKNINQKQVNENHCINESTQVTVLDTVGSSQRTELNSHLNTIFGGDMGDRSPTESMTSPRKSQRRLRVHFAPLNDSTPKEARTLESKPQFFTPQMKPKEMKDRRKDFIIKNRLSLQVSTMRS